VQVHPFDPASAFGWLVEVHLHPEPFWFVELIDRPARALCTVASAHHLALDEPDRPIDPALTAVLARLAAGDPALLRVPRMPEATRAALMERLVASVDEPVRGKLAARRDAMARRPDDHWRPGTLDDFAGDCDEPTRLRWAIDLRHAAGAAVCGWLAAHKLSLEGLVHWVFD
jgi:hypothetical protein